MGPNPVAVLTAEPQLLAELLLGPETLLAWARSPSVRAGVRFVLETLEPDPLNAATREYYLEGERRFGEAWRHCDSLGVLHAAAALLAPRRALEVGVLRGRSLAMIASAAPTCELHCVDAWISGYAGLPDGGPDLLRHQLARLGWDAVLHVWDGDSASELSELFARDPGLEFDLIHVDGDHREEGARRDLEQLLPRLTVGGVLVFDDLNNQRCPWLARVWAETVAGHADLEVATYSETGDGVGLAVRRRLPRSAIGFLGHGAAERQSTLAQRLEEALAMVDEVRQAAEIERERYLGKLADLEARLASLER